jgi:hypothetical protein
MQIVICHQQPSNKLKLLTLEQQMLNQKIQTFFVILNL